jgi:enoyl-CoA hydratase/carnithine racemase
VRLARLIGLARARELVLTGRKVDAAEALALGLGSHISAAQQSVSSAIALAQEIAANAPVAVAAAKASLEEGWDLPLDEALARERAHYEKVLASEDRREGLAAFAEKRRPDWKGR